jgi:hypothetical protein
MDGRTRIPRSPLKAVILAALVGATASGIAVASPVGVGSGDEIAIRISQAAAPDTALTAQRSALVRRVPGALSRGQGIGRKRQGRARRRGRPGTFPPALIPARPSPSPSPAQGVEPAAPTPAVAPTPASPPAPIAASPPPAPIAAPEPEPEPEPAPIPEPEPEPAPIPAPEPEPIPAPEPKAPAGIEPGVPVEPSPATPGSLVLGIDGGYAGWSSAEVAYRAELGAAVTRHEWDPRQPVAEQDEEVEIAAERIRTRIHALLGANQLGDPVHYRDWVVAFVRRYGASGSFWAERPHLDAARYAIDTIELGNEPYFGEMSPTLYADTVRPTLEAIDDLGLPVKVVLPVYLHGANTSWIETLYERVPGLNSLFQAFAFHPYWYGHHPATPGDGGPFERLDTLRARMNALGAAEKPIYLTEYGESTAACGSECVSEAEQAEHLAAMLAAVVARSDWNVDMLSVFQLLDRGTASLDRELQFGLLREDGTPKPSYAPLRAAMQVYR